MQLDDKYPSTKQNDILIDVPSDTVASTSAELVSPTSSNGAKECDNAVVLSGGSEQPSGEPSRAKGDGEDPKDVPDSDPPPFALYEAECWEDGEGNIISHDKHLNEDGEALYRFILEKAGIYPRIRASFWGSHLEHRTREVRHTDSNGHTTTRIEHYTVRITDFRFAINMTRYLQEGPFHFSVGDSEPAYRGGKKFEIDEVGADGKTARRLARDDEETKFAQWSGYRTQSGIAPWTAEPPVWAPEATRYAPLDEEILKPGEAAVLKSTKTVRQWADEYCKSKKILKEFRYDKIIYGWNFQALETALTELIRQASYNGDLQVTFPQEGTKICVRPDNFLSRTLSNSCYKILLWITLIYPFIWLFKRFSGRGGGKWEVCGGAYAFKRWVHVEEGPDGALPMPPPPLSPPLLITAPPVPGQAYGQPAPDYYYAGSAPSSAGPPILFPPPNGPPNNAFVRTSSGLSRHTGVKEGQWFREWEDTVRSCVLNRVNDYTPLECPTVHPSSRVGMILDGYNE